MKLAKQLLFWLMLASPALAEPVITNVYVSASTPTTATIVWTTDEASSSQILWGYNLALPYSNTVDTTMVTSHSMTLTLLSAGPMYYFATVSKDSLGRIAQSTTYQFSLCGSPTTPVAGTVNQFYQLGPYTLTWVPPAGSSGTPTVCGQPFATTVTGNLNGSGSFSNQVADAYKVTPGPGTWNVQVQDLGDLAPITIQAPLSSVTQDISMQLQLAASASGLTGCIVNTITNHAWPPACAGNGGSSTLVQVNGVNLATQSPVNFATSSSVSFTNPSVGQIQAAVVVPGTNGQVLINSSNSLGAITIGGDATLNSSTGSLIVTKSNGTAFGTAAFATLGNTGTDVPQLSSGLLNASVIPWANPGSIGSGTPNSGVFSALSDTGAAGAGTYCVQISPTGLFSNTGAACGSSSGAVNSVANSDSTLTISPTTGAVVASLNLAHADTWSALQTFSAGTNLSGASAPFELGGSAGTLGQCVTSAGSGATPTWGTCGGSASWSGLTNPSTNLSLTMQAYTTALTYNASTGTSDLFKLTDTASNIGTGILFHVTTASGSTEAIAQFDANGNGWKFNSSGQFIGIGSTTHGLVIPAGTAISPSGGNVVFSSDPTVGLGYMSENGGAAAQICDVTNLACGSNISNVTITTGTGAVSATCSSNSLSSAVTMAGVSTSSTLTFTPTTDLASVGGWDTGALFFVPVLASGSFQWRLCTGNSGGTTPGGSVTWNVSSH